MIMRIDFIKPRDVRWQISNVTHTSESETSNESASRPFFAKITSQDVRAKAKAKSDKTSIRVFVRDIQQSATQIVGIARTVELQMSRRPN